MDRLKPLSLQLLLMIPVLAFTLSAAGQGGTIVNATWGAANRRVDVTSRVQSLARNGVLNFQVTNEILGAGDPFYGRVKELVIRVRERNGQTRDYRFTENSMVNLRVAGNGFMPPPVPGSTWQGDPVGTCINAVRARIQQDYGNRIGINLPPSAARVGNVSNGQLQIPVNGTGQINPPGQPAFNTRYDCSIDKRFGRVTSVNYMRPNMGPQPR
jgi:hypothetical protein